jgi:hypothetical protein
MRAKLDHFKMFFVEKLSEAYNFLAHTFQFTNAGKGLALRRHARVKQNLRSKGISFSLIVIYTS